MGRAWWRHLDRASQPDRQSCPSPCLLTRGGPDPGQAEAGVWGLTSLLGIDWLFPWNVEPNKGFYHGGRQSPVRSPVQPAPESEAGPAFSSLPSRAFQAMRFISVYL